MKKAICILTALVLVLCALSLTSCGESGNKASQAKIDKSGHKILFKDGYKSGKVKATLLNSASGATKEAACEKAGKDDEVPVYACYGDTAKYDKVIFTYGESKTDELAFNDCVSGWHCSVHGVYPYTEGEKEADLVKYSVKTFDYGTYEKDVYICTPDGYDKNAKESYPVIYMTDGQNLFDRRATTYGSWGVYESVKSMQKTKGKGAVIVGICNPSTNRDSELTPDIGDVTSSPETYENGKGKQFSDFVVNKVVPYIEKNYNVATDPDNVAICGSSSGGIESFYIGMEHPEKFGTIGALSPAFGLFDDNTWVKYLQTKKFKDNYPKVYLYCGNADELEKYLMPGTKSMPSNLAKISYPKNKIFETYYEKGLHNERYWRYIFPDFLKFFIK